MRYLVWLCFITSVLITIQSGWTREYVVDGQNARASDENPGIAERPFKTINKAAQVVQAGDKVIVKAGVYRETVRMQRGGTPQKPIIFVAEPTGSVVIKGSDIITGWGHMEGNIWRKSNWKLTGRLGTQSGQDFVFRREQVFYNGKPLKHVEQRKEMKSGSFWVDLKGKALYVWLADKSNPNQKQMEVSVRPTLWTGNELTPYVHLRGFQFEHCANLAHRGAIHLEFAHGWVIEDCVVEWMNGAGLWLTNCTRIQVRRCHFNNNGQIGFAVGGGYDIAFEDCETSHNNWKGYDAGWEAGGLKIASAARRVRLIHHHAAFNNGPGIWFDYAGNGHEIIGCVVHDNTANAGIQIEVTFGVLIANNLCYRNTAPNKGNAGFFGSGILLQESGFCRIYHNTCVENDNGLSLVGSNRAVLSMANEIVNNIFAFNREYQVQVWDSVAQRVTGWTFPLPSFVKNPEQWAEERLNRFDYNLYFDPKGQPLIEWGGPYNPGTPDKGRYSDLAEFTKKTAEHSGWAEEAHGLIANPKFVNKGADDFHLQSDSPAIDKGIPLKDVPQDFAGKPRPQGKAPDLGAYE